MDVKLKRACDVLVVGGGNAGLVAAIEAKNAGAKVLVLEKSPRKIERWEQPVFLRRFQGGNREPK